MKNKILNLLIFCLLFSCRDKDPTKPGNQRKPPKPVFHKLRIGEAKDYIWAKPGSYWIYKNTKTNELDTWTCNGFYYDSFIVKGTEDYARHITLDFDYLRTSKHSTFYNWIYDDKTPAYLPETFKKYFILINRLCPSGQNFPFSYNYIENNHLIGEDTLLKIQNKDYFKVLRFNIAHDDIWYPDDYLGAIKYPNAIYYWAKDVGLIKRENLTENFSWELIEYNIIK